MITPPLIETIRSRYAQSEQWLTNYDLEHEKTLILDAGAGEQRARKFFKKNKYIAQDFGEYKGGGTPLDCRGIWDKEWDTSGCDILSDICAIPVQDKTFDLIICLEVLEHLPEPLAAISELARLLKPGGKLVFTAPNLCAVHQEPHFYYSGFSQAFFEKAVCRKVPQLSLNYLGLEGDFTTAHLGELKSLEYAQSSLALRLLTRACHRFIKSMFIIIKSLRGFNQPKSCSGFYVIYDKI